MYAHIYTSSPHKNIQEFTVCPFSLCWMHWLKGTKHVRERKDAFFWKQLSQGEKSQSCQPSLGWVHALSEIRGCVWEPAVVPGLWREGTDNLWINEMVVGRCLARCLCRRLTQVEDGTRDSHVKEEVVSAALCKFLCLVKHGKSRHTQRNWSLVQKALQFPPYTDIHPQWAPVFIHWFLSSWTLPVFQKFSHVL